MTDKEKAKAYDNALNWMRSVYLTMTGAFKEDAEYYFPELKESEDDRIRKAIKLLVKMKESDSFGFEPVYGASYKEMLSWLEKQREQPNKVSIWKHWNNGIAGNGEGKLIYLIKSGNTYFLRSCLGFECDYIELSELDKLYVEKQGEQKPTDKVEPKFKVGDWIVPNNGEPRVFRVERLEWPDSIISSFLGNQFINTFTLNEQYHLWTIKDAKDGDVLYSERGSGVESIHLVSSWKKVDGENTLCSVCSYRIEDDEIITGGLGAIWWHGVQDPFFPATKEQRDLLFQKMKEAGYEWDAEKKELKKIEQEQTELPNGEDYGIDSLYHASRILEKTLGEVEGYQSDDGILEHKCAIEAVNRLYKQKPAWSEEDEKMIDNIIKNLDEGEWLDIYQVDWLKSLKERVQPRNK